MTRYANRSLAAARFGAGPGAGRSRIPESAWAGFAGKSRWESAIGREVREFRCKLNMTVSQNWRRLPTCRPACSKIENGQTSPSLATLQELSRAFRVPVTAFFRKFEEERNATFVKAGMGLTIERRGTRAGHQYQLLGHSLAQPGGRTPSHHPEQGSDVFPVFQHEGIEFIYLLEGEVGYRHGDKIYPSPPATACFRCRRPMGRRN